MNSINATDYLHELIKKLSNNRNAVNYRGSFTITAKILDIVKIDRVPIDCQLVIQHDSVDLNIFWEDYGYKNYKDIGLYGKANSKYYEITERSESSFRISDKNSAYELTFEW